MSKKTFMVKHQSKLATELGLFDESFFEKLKDPNKQEFLENNSPIVNEFVFVNIHPHPWNLKKGDIVYGTFQDGWVTIDTVGDNYYELVAQNSINSRVQAFPWLLACPKLNRYMKLEELAFGHFTGAKLIMADFFVQESVYDSETEVMVSIPDVLANDSNPYVRARIAEQGYNLEKFLHDESPIVREVVASLGYGLDTLRQDPDPFVSSIAKFEALNEKDPLPY